MKAFAAVLILLALTGCTTRTEHGECVGLGDEKKPDLVYKVSARNLIICIVFLELIVPPVIVVVDDFYCPVGKK
jgi:hypothetical protein